MTYTQATRIAALKVSKEGPQVVYFDRFNEIFGTLNLETFRQTKPSGAVIIDILEKRS